MRKSTELRRFDSGRVKDELNRPAGTVGAVGRSGRSCRFRSQRACLRAGRRERRDHVRRRRARQDSAAWSGRDRRGAVQAGRRRGGQLRSTAWSQINLITPLQGVESVVAPEGAAGGSDPQDGEAVVRFAPANLHSRNRALTLRDLEVPGAAVLAGHRAGARGRAVDRRRRSIVVDARQRSASRRAPCCARSCRTC